MWSHFVEHCATWWPLCPSVSDGKAVGITDLVASFWFPCIANRHKASFWDLTASSVLVFSSIIHSMTLDRIFQVIDVTSSLTFTICFALLELMSVRGNNFFRTSNLSLPSVSPQKPVFLLLYVKRVLVFTGMDENFVFSKPCITVLPRFLLSQYSMRMKKPNTKVSG